jgi:Tol biopolymer transport system component
VSAAFEGSVVATRDGTLMAHGVGGAGMDTLVASDAAAPAVCGVFVAYVLTGGASPEIWELDTTSGEATLVMGDAIAPDYSLDCSLLVMTSNPGDDGDILVLERASGSTTHLTDDDVADGAPGFVASDRVAWSRRPAEARDAALYHAAVAGGMPMLWLDGPGNDQRPRLSAGGDKVVFTRCDSDDGDICEVVLATPDGTMQGALQAPGCSRRDAGWYTPPDGTDMLVFNQRAAVSTGAPAGDLWHIVLAGQRGTVFWSTTPLTTEDTEPACCLVP